MFRRHKHVFTCPDTIYLRQKAKSRNRTIILMEVATLVAMAAWIYVQERKEENEPLTEDSTMEYPNRTA